MKKVLLLFTAGLLSMSNVIASEIKSDKVREHLDMTKRYRYAQPIVFIERGVEFLVFPDGSFDFNTNYANNYHNDIYYRGTNTKRASVNRNHDGLRNRVRFSNARSRGLSVAHDRDGKVRRIGDVFLNYDRRGKIKRVGSIYLNYNHGNGRLKQVGGLRVNYNHWGEIVNMKGQVSPLNDGCAVCGVWECTTEHMHHEHGHGDFYNDDYNDDYYYYKQNGKVKKKKKKKNKRK